MKRVLAALMSVAMLCAAPIGADANTSAVYEGELNYDKSITWSLNRYSGELSINGVGTIDDFIRSPFEAVASLITSVTLDDSITSLGRYLFSGCSNIHSIRLSEELDSISDYSFYNCSSLEEINLPERVSRIGASAFDGCVSLGRINADDGNACFVSIDDILYSKDESVLVRAPARVPAQTSFTVPSGVRTIERKAFLDNSTISEVVLGRSVEQIKDNAFLNSSISSVYIYNDDCILEGDCIFPDNAVLHCSSTSNACSYARRNNLRYTTASEAVCTSHSCTSRIVYPTCTSRGYTEYSCRYCDFSERRDYKGALGHNLKSSVSKATFSTNGKRESRCSRCGYVSSSSTIYKVSKPTISKSRYTYDGSSKKPVPIVKNTKGQTISKENYSLSYSANVKNVGQHWVRVTLKNSYADYRTVYYTIVPKGVSIKSCKAGKSKSIQLKWSKNTTQTTGYQIQYAADKSFSSDVKSLKVDNKITSRSIKVKKKGRIYYFRIRAYKTIGDKCYYSDWSAYKRVKSK